jgi:hypothetical protein
VRSQKGFVADNAMSRAGRDAMGRKFGLIRCEDDNDSARAESPGYQSDVKQSAVNRRLLLKVAMEKCTQQNKGFERE